MNIKKAIGLLAATSLSGCAESSLFSSTKQNSSVIMDSEVTAGHGEDDCAILSIYTPKEILSYKQTTKGEVDVIEGTLGERFGFELPNAIMSCSGYITKGELADSKVYDDQELHKYAHSDEESKYKAHYHVTGNEKFIGCVANNIQNTEFKFKESTKKIVDEARTNCENIRWVEKISPNTEKGICL